MVRSRLGAPAAPRESCGTPRGRSWSSCIRPPPAASSTPRQPLFGVGDTFLCAALDGWPPQGTLVTWTPRARELSWRGRLEACGISGMVREVTREAVEGDAALPAELGAASLTLGWCFRCFECVAAR